MIGYVLAFGAWLFSLICVAALCAAAKDPGPGDPYPARPVRTTRYAGGLPGWDGGSISDYFVDLD